MFLDGQTTNEPNQCMIIYLQRQKGILINRVVEKLDINVSQCIQTGKSSNLARIYSWGFNYLPNPPIVICVKPRNNTTIKVNEKLHWIFPVRILHSHFSSITNSSLLLFPLISTLAFSIFSILH